MVLALPSLEEITLFCLKSLPGWRSEAVSWLSHSHGNSGGYSETCRGLGRMTPEAWHGPRWLLCQAVAGQECRMDSQQPGPRERGWEESGGRGPWGGRHPGVFAQRISRQQALCLAAAKPPSAEGSVSSEQSLRRRQSRTPLPPWERAPSTVEQTGEQSLVSLQASVSLLCHERPGLAWALWGVWLGSKEK